MKILTKSFRAHEVIRSHFTIPPLLLVGKIALLAIPLVIAWHGPAFAQVESFSEAGSQALTLRGFGTLGVTRTNSDQAEFVRDLSQPDGVTNHWSGKIDSLAGIQANFQLAEKLEAVAQVVSHYRYDKTFRPDLTWAFLKYDPDSNFSLRAGRLGTEFYMLADSRQVGYSYLTVRPPGDYYGSLVFSYIDGLDVSATTAVAGGLLRGKLFAGVSPEKIPFVKPLTLDLEGSPIMGGHVDYLRGSWQFRLSHAQIRFENELPMNALVESMGGPPGFLSYVPELSVAGKWSRFSSIGLVYDDSPLQLQLMLSKIRHGNAAYEDSKAGYVIAAYRLGQVTPYLGYSQVKSSPKTLASPPPAPLVSLTTSLMAQSHSDQHTTILGARWDFHRNTALKVQLDHVRGTPQSIFPYRDESPGFNGNLNVLSLTLDFIF